MKVQYEEKTYESYFNNELDSLSSIYFPPGQVLEGFLGFDAAAYSNNPELWRLFSSLPYTHSYPGLGMRELASLLEDNLDHIIDSIPEIKANLFFQYKRPEYLTTANSNEWSHWKQAYYRYKIYDEQQALLEKIDTKFGSQALALYSSPAISSLADLIKYKINKEIIRQSNFKKPSELSNHNKNTYTEAGNYSIAFSEPETIKNLDIISTIKELDSIKNMSTRQFIIETALNISIILKEDVKYKDVFLTLLSEYEELKQLKLLYSHLIMKCFREITGIQWLISIKA